ncbi:MAG: NAD(+)/NADH kinase, partial [Firmicutes bacterium]|nr:NAD(+)/NADH kinase [Bacillota bacterium]
HTLNSRSIITNAYSQIEVVVSDKNRDILITIDGQEGTNLQEGDTVVITKSSLETHLIRLSGYGFFNLLRDKLTERIHGDRRVAHSNEI